MKKFKVTCTSLIQFERIYETEDIEEARKMGQMDADDGQIGHFQERQSIDGEVLRACEVKLI